MLKKLTLFLALILACSMQAAVYTPSSVPQPKVQGQNEYVANPDAIISDSDVVFLNRCAAMLEQKTDVELCVVAIQSMGDYDVFDFAHELFQRWGIGKEGKNTGVLILFVQNSHDIRIHTGVGIEGVLPDARCSQVINETMIPAFKEEDYGGGLCLGALRIYEICTDGEAPEELRNMKSITNRGKYAEEEGPGFWTVFLIFISGLGILALIAKWAAIKRCPKCKKRRAKSIRSQILVEATFQHAGKGERTYRCKHCGAEFILPYTIPRLTRSYSSGGGGGGFSGRSGGGSWGGGSSIGGGASGKW